MRYREIIDTNRHGIRRIRFGKPPSGNRGCIVPWRHEGLGRKAKRSFKTRDEAKKLAKKIGDGLEAYKCKYHGWHIGHNYSKGKDASKDFHPADNPLASV